jgi:peptidoglycan/xylan/chitin deacetylase (PgdA/CDA1 family)
MTRSDAVRQPGDTPARIRRLGDSVLANGLARPLIRLRAPRRLAVLAYHGVDDARAFERHLDYLAARLRPVTLADVERAVRGVTDLPAGSVLVTFDDGHRSVLEDGLPLLQHYRVPAVLFVVAGLVGTRQPFWWTEVEARYAAGGRLPDLAVPSGAALVGRLKTVPDASRRAALDRLRRDTPDVTMDTAQLSAEDLRRWTAAGFDVGNHTWSHPCLDQCPEAEARSEVRRAHEALTAALGAPPTTFAYPNGNLDPRVEPVLAELGYTTGFLFDHRLADVGHGRSPLRISRVRVRSDASLDRFAAIVSGLHPAIHRLRGGR